jgi:hypothetical protein
VVNPDNTDLLTSVKQENLELDTYVNQPQSDLHNPKSEETGKNVNKLDILIQNIKHKNVSRASRKIAFEPIVQLTEDLLDDHHSTAMFYKVLGVLYPERLDLYVAAVRVALQAIEDGPLTNSGAVFVNTLRDFADVAGVDLGLKRSSTRSEETRPDKSDKNLGIQLPILSAPTFTPPSVDEAIWSETQSVLRRQMTRATYDAVIQGTELLGREKGIYVVGVQSKMAQEWLANRLHDVVQRALSNVLGVAVTIEFRVVNGSR